MDSNKKVSIIVPVYNSELYIERCLESLCTQTYLNIEIILVDDSSMDSSYMVCKKYEKKDKRIKLFQKGNGGPSLARNYGIKKMTGEYCFFCDSDDYLDSNVIETLVNHCGQTDILYGVRHINVFGEKKNESICDDLYYTDNFIENIMTKKIMGNIWGYLFKSEYIKELKFDSNTSCMEDTIFLINYLNQYSIQKVRFLEQESFYYYCYNGCSITSNKNLELECCIKRCYDYFYSYDIINDITSKKYSKQINDNKLVLLEYHMSLCNIRKSNYVLFFKKFKIYKPSTRNIRFNSFYIIYNRRMVLLLKMYFMFLKTIRRD